MARPPARPPARLAAAAAAYVAFWGALAALAEPPPYVNGVRPAACHAAAAPSRAWAVAHRVYDEVDLRTRRLAPGQRTVVARAILEEAARVAMDPLLVLAVIQVESRFDARAASRAGAVGLMQLLHPTMREEAERSGLPSDDPWDPVANVRAGVRYLHRLVSAFEDLEVALMAYNAGPNRIRRHLREGGVPARFLAYPRTVVRELARLSAPGGRPPERPAAPAAFAASHARPGAPEQRPGPVVAASVRAPEPRAARGRDPSRVLVAVAADAARRGRGAVRRGRSPCGGSTARPPRSRS
jgi:soluble lytic murein transglycosylase-like protein